MQVARVGGCIILHSCIIKIVGFHDIHPPESDLFGGYLRLKFEQLGPS